MPEEGASSWAKGATREIQGREQLAADNYRTAKKP